MLNKKKFIVVIPARYKSKRLPGKPLISLKGIPMIIRTCMRVAKAVPKEKILVATDDYRIIKICQKYNFNYLKTKSTCLTGTDRVAEVAKKIKFNYYINIQGDEPIFNPEDIRKLLHYIKKYPRDVILGYTKIYDKKDFKNKNIPKVIVSKDEYLIFASRSPIPFQKKYKKKAFRQVLAYSFPRKKLLDFTKVTKKTFYENIEDVEILRFLEKGIPVKLCKMSNKSLSLDTKKDLKKILRKISK